MSSIPYSGGTIVNTTFTTTTGTRQEIVTALQTHLTSAGWSVISGGGTGTVVMKSATTASPKSNSIRVRLLEVGSGNCAQVKIENDAGTLTSQAYYLLPAAGKVFRIIACQYNFFVFTPQPSAAREFICGGTLHIPDFLDTVTTGDLGWIQGNAQNDTDTSIRYTLRTKLGVYANVFSSSAWCSQIRNNTLTNINDDTQSAGHLVMPSWLAISTHNLQWADDSYVSREAILGFGVGSTSATNKWQGIIHNAMIVDKSYAGDDTTVNNYDGHAWMSVTHNNSSITNHLPIGTLFIAIS